jgi:hypothetical protein
LITLEDVQEELSCGPNGGLIYCMEYLSQNLEWLTDQITGGYDHVDDDNDDDHHNDDAVEDTGHYTGAIDYTDDYLIFDCPGQIELYSHHTGMKRIIHHLQVTLGYTLVCVSMLDSLLVYDTQRFLAGVFMSLSFMCSLELPHINVLTKCDLVDPKLIDKYLGKYRLLSIIEMLLFHFTYAYETRWDGYSTQIISYQTHHIRYGTLTSIKQTFNQMNSQNRIQFK